MTNKNNKNDKPIEDPGSEDPGIEAGAIEDPGTDIEPGIPDPSADLFGELDGLLPDNVSYSIYRIGKTGEQEFVSFANPPYSILNIAQNFGGGKYIIMARDPKSGKYVKRRTVTVASDVWDIVEDSDAGDQELKFLKKMEVYKKLFNDSSKVDTQIMEVIGQQMKMMVQMSSQMMMQQMEMMKQFNEAMNDSTGGIDSILKIAEQFTSGKLNLLPGKNKEKKAGEG